MWRTNWRRFIQKVMKILNMLYSRNLWKLLKWNKWNNSDTSVILWIFSLHQSENKKSQNDCAAKVNILAITNFNITDKESATYFLNIDETMITDQIKQIIRSLFTKKTANLNNISNEILKVIYKAIKKNLAAVITQCFINNLLLSCLKKFTTMMLDKKKKRTIYFLTVIT